MRAAATLIMSLVMALGAIGLAVAAPGGGQRLASAQIQAASGAVTISNSRAGQAVFDAPSMRPGQGVSGTLTIGNHGDVAGDFAVRPTGLHDTPGEYGGVLSQRIELVLFDVTDMPDAKTIFDGTPASFAQVSLGKFEPGEERDYLFAATLPDGHGLVDDNLYQGSGMSLGFEWRASPSASAPTVTPAPTAPPAATPVSTPTTTVTPPPTSTPTVVDYSSVLGLPTANRCAKGGKIKFKVKSPRGTKVKTATVAVNGKVKVRVKRSKSVTLKKLKKTFKVTVAVKASNGRTYTGTRVYRVCGK
jgi:hypothetical protein